MNSFDLITSKIAEFIWNPVMCLLYLITGVLFLAATQGIVWTKGFGVVWRILRNDRSAYTDKVIPHTKGFPLMGRSSCKS